MAAMDRMLLGCVYFSCYTFSLIVAQDSPAESVFRVLSAEQLQELNWRQNPELLEIAAKTGENVTIFINSSSQGGVVQENVNTVLNCTPWLMNFPGVTVRWYKYRLSSLNHYLESDRTFQNPETIDSMRFSIEGQQDEIFRIIRSLIAEDAEDSSRGIYECEVCTAGGMIGSEDCHSANTTILNVGRPPIINRGIGREPVKQNPIYDTYNIGSTIYIEIDPLDPERNRPMQIVRLQCADVGDVEELNIPSALPTAVVSWEHTSLDGTRTAFFAENAVLSDIVMVGYMPPPEFGMQFPLLVMTDVFSVSTNSPPATSALDFATENITRNASTLTYQALMQAFGTWTCTLNNSLGSETATTFITDMLLCEARGFIAVTVTCTDTRSDTTFQCSFNDGQLLPCVLPLILTSNVSPPGNHTVRIVTNTGIEDVATYSIIATDTKVLANVPQLEVVLSSGSPSVRMNTIGAEFSTTRPVTFTTCFLRYANKREYKHCSGGNVTFSDLQPGRYILKIQVRNKFLDSATAKTVIMV